jgi:hypothetical protein
LALQIDNLQAQKDLLAANLTAMEKALAAAEAEQREREMRFEQEFASKEAQIRIEIQLQTQALTADERERVLAQALSEARAKMRSEINDAVRRSQAERDIAAREANERAQKLTEEVARLQTELARAKAASLPLPSVPPPALADKPGSRVASLDPLASTGLAPLILGELKRLGCYVGPVTADWGSKQAQQALRVFSLKDRSRIPSEPTSGFLDALNLKSDGFCTPVCSAGTTMQNGQCVAIRKRTIQAEPLRSRTARPPNSTEAPAVSRGSPASRCFVFGGRQYCE